MHIGAVCLALTILVQVPAPDAAARESGSLRAEEIMILAKETSQLEALRDRLAKEGDRGGAAEVGRYLPEVAPQSGGTKFATLAEVVPGRRKGLANVGSAGVGVGWRNELAKIRGESSRLFFMLAEKAGGGSLTQKHFALADRCLRGVLAREPDQTEARRLVGYMAYEGGWARPYAVKQMRAGKVLDGKYGWVPLEWLAHLERGELPATKGGGQAGKRWVGAEEADGERREWSKGWEIRTEHFFIKTNVPFSEAIAFGRHLEAFHDLFFSILADVVGEKLPLARRFKDKGAVGEIAGEPHLVYYFRSRDEYVERVRALQGDSAEESLGLYIPPEPGRVRRAPAYFFRDKGGELDVTATLYHEVSHQLLFESGGAGVGDFRKNAGNFWVFEGMGTYFESVTTKAEGMIEVGGRAGRRFEAAAENLLAKRKMVRLADFVKLDQKEFNREEDVYLHYQQAVALTTLLMDGDGRGYREDFLDYFRDAFQGRLKRTTGKGLNDRVGMSFETMEGALREYLGTGR